MRLFLFLIGCAVLAACKPRSSARGEQKVSLDLLQGRWESLNENTRQIEEWSRVEKDHFKGRGYVLEGVDTTFIEFLEIRSIHDTLHYCAQVSNHNDSETVLFKLIRTGNGRWEFVNPQHDFPQKIVYELESDSSLRTFIEGPRNGRTVRVNFDFRKR